jgi:TatD DNase family protein
VISALPFIDIHTHHQKHDSEVISIFNVLIGKNESLPIGDNQYFSVGLHPWFIDEKKFKSQLEKVEKLAYNHHCVAIGETGLDRLTKAQMSLQQKVFEHHLIIAQKVSKPVIIHNVKAQNEILEVYKKTKIDIPLIFHGFNNNQHIANLILKRGCYFSFGHAVLKNGSNASRLCQTIPASRFFLETDESETSINTIYEIVANLRNITIEQLKEIIVENFKNIFTSWK